MKILSNKIPFFVLLFALLSSTCLAQENAEQESAGPGESEQPTQLLEAENEALVAEPTDPFIAKLYDLSVGSFRAKIEAVEALTELEDERVLPTLKAMQQGELYVVDESETMVVVKELEKRIVVTNLLSQEMMPEITEDDISKVRINNRLRRTLRAGIAVLELNAKDKHVRYSAAKDILKKPDDDLREVLEKRLELEEVAKVKEVIALILAIIDIESDDPKVRRASLEVLAESVEPEAVVVVRRIAEKDDEGNFDHEDKELAAFAAKSLKSIETKLSVLEGFKNFLFGYACFSTGCCYRI